MYILEQIKTRVAKRINLTLGQDLVKPENLTFPSQSELGDLSLACFDVFKKIKVAGSALNSPVDLARDLAEKISAHHKAAQKSGEGQGCALATIKAVGPYLNFIINKNYLANELFKELEKKNYGVNQSDEKKTVMIEYSNANTHKEYHIGHLRNIAYGDAVGKILSANSFEVIPVSYINDFGIHAAKTIWYYQKHPLDLNYDKTLNKGYILGQMYVSATKELEKNPEYKTEVGEMMKKIESRKGKEYQLWQKTRKWTINQFAKIYKELGVKFTHIFYESEFINKGLEIAEDLKSQGVLKESRGAMIIDLEKYNLGVLLFFRTDGTALYPVADLPLAMEKFEKYKLDKSICVVDARQSLYFKQLFKVLGLLGYRKEMIHLGYDVVKLPSGMMSSRLGNVITYEDLKREATKRATQEIKTRHKKWSEAKIKKTATVIVNGALKFEMIKVDALQIITFDIDKALKFEGFTAAYLQYTYARINSIVRKSIKSIKSKVHKVESQKIDFSNLSEPKENNLIIKLAKYPEIVKKAGENYDPSEIAKYLFELAQEFNDYYHAVPVLKAEEKIRDARVVLIKAVAQVIRAGLGLLGIQTANEM